MDSAHSCTQKSNQRKKRRQEEKKRNYTFISETSKQDFLEKFLFNGLKIQQAAQQTGIKYSTAKTVLFLHRKKIRKQFLEMRKQQQLLTVLGRPCNFKTVNILEHVKIEPQASSQQGSIEVVVSIGNVKIVRQ